MASSTSFKCKIDQTLLSPDISHKKRLVELTQSTMMDVRAALREFYLINTSWPVSLELIQSANGYYVGDLITPYGMIEGDVTINA